VPVLLAALGSLVVSLDAAVNIAFPAMARAFGIGPGAIRWVIICYVFTYALTAVAAGLLADRAGPAPVFAAGLWLSVLAFLSYPFLGSLAAVLAARVVQGVGGGLVYGTAPALVTLSLPRERHGRGLGLLAFGHGVGLTAGPIVGGALVGWGWPWVFVFRAPVAVAAGVLAPLVLPRRPGTGAWRLPPRRDLAAPAVIQALVLAFLANGAQFSVWLLAPFYLVSFRGLSATLGGLFFVLTPLGSAVAGPLGGLATDRLGRRAPMVLGLALEAAGLAALSRAGAETPLAVVALALLAVGLGLGAFQVPNLAQVMAAFPRGHQGAAGGLAMLGRTLGVVAGVQANALVFGAVEAGHGPAAGFAAAFGVSAGVCALAAALAARPARMPAGTPGSRTTMAP
jgi:MFS family permease